MRRVLLFVIIIPSLVSCQASPSTAQVIATAIRQGCWPYGAARLIATRTPLATRTIGAGTPTRTPQLVTPTITPTDELLGTPLAAIPECTPLPRTPTRTASPIPTWTPYTWSTPRPAGIASQAPQNISNFPGTDTISQIAVHPLHGWPAVAWANRSIDQGQGAIYVRTKQRNDWGPATAISTAPSVDEPAIAVDADGRVHVLYATASNMLMHATSDDAGRTWQEQPPLPVPSNINGIYFPRLRIDPSGQLHALYAVGDGSDDGLPQIGYVHAVLQDGAWRSDYRFLPGAQQMRGDLAFVTLPDSAIRTLAMIGCRRDCPSGQHPIIGYQDGAGPWRMVDVPSDWRIAAEEVDAISGVAYEDRSGQQIVCFSWSQYSASGVFVRCSMDGGTSWSSLEVVAFSGDPQAPRGYSPSLLYAPAVDQLIVVWILRDGDPATYYPVMSYRASGEQQWFPNRDEVAGPAEPVIKLFGNTQRNDSRMLTAAYTGQGAAWLGWQERAGNTEVFTASFDPSGLLAANGGTP